MVDEANQLLAKQGSPPGCCRRTPCRGWALRCCATASRWCTFDRLVSDARMGLETEIAAILFE